MTPFDQILARGEAEPVYVLEWAFRTHVLEASLAAAGTQLLAGPGAFTGWPSFGYAEFDDGSAEILAWSGVAPDGSRLLNLRRGLHRSAPADHAAGAGLREYGLWRPMLSRPHPAFPDALDCLRVPQIGAVGIDPRKGSASLAAVRLELVEAAHPAEPTAPWLADLLAHLNGARGNGLRGRHATLRLGFRELAHAADFAVIARGIVHSAGLSGEGTRVSIELRPLHGGLKDRRLFAGGRTRLATPLLVDDDEITLADAAALPAPAGVVRINEEFMGYAGVAGGTLTGVTRGLYGSMPSVHEIDDEATGVFVLGPENPLSLFLQVLTSTGAGTNGPWDVLPKAAGLGVPLSLINTEAIEAIRTGLLTQTTLSFVIDEEEDDAKRWLEREVLRPAGCSLVLDGDGTISLAFYGPPSPLESVGALGADDLLRGSALPADLGYEGVVNAVEVRHSRDPVSGEFRARYLLVDNDSIAAHGEAKKLVLDLAGVHGEYSPVDPAGQGEHIAALVALRLQARYAAPRRAISWQAPLSRARIAVGELLEIAEDRLPNERFDEGAGRHESRGTGGTLCEVVSRRVDFERGRVSLGLLETEFTGRRYLFIHEDAAPEYGAASAAEKRLGYIAADTDTGASLNEQALPFADGGGPYRVYPA